MIITHAALAEGQSALRAPAGSAYCRVEVILSGHYSHHARPHMQLETISKTPDQRISDTSIVLIHGAWHGAWCWEDNFLDYFLSRGWETHAISLRGHGGSEGGSKLRWTSIRDYVADIEQVVSTLGRPPILVGHSMGGFVVQKFLEKHEVPGAVLLASVPHTGNRRVTMRFARKYPLSFLASLLTLSPYWLLRKPGMLSWACYSDQVEADTLANHHKKLGEESFRASLDMGNPKGLPNPSKNNSPVLVVGSENDALISVREVKQNAAALGVDAKIFQGMPHFVMSAAGWENVANCIAEWARNLRVANASEPAPVRG